MDRYREDRLANLSSQGLGGLHLGGSNQSPRIYRCLEPLLLLGQKKKYEANGLAIQEQENSLRTPLEI